MAPDRVDTAQSRKHVVIMSLSLLVLCSLLLDLASSSPVEPAGAPSEEYCSYCIDTNSEFCCRFFNTCCSYVSPCPSPARPQTSACEMKKCTRSSECRRGQVCCNRGLSCGLSLLKRLQRTSLQQRAVDS